MKSRFSRLVAHLRQKTPTDRTLLALLTLLSLYLITGAISGGRTLVAPFFDRGCDLFMDYFNSLRDAAQGARVYTERRVIYPPMANLIFLVFSRLVPSAYLDTPFGARHTWRQYPTAILSLVLFLAIPLLMTALIQNAERRHLGLPRRALVPLLFNLPLLFLIERGNILLLTLPALLFFLYYYNSPRTHVRELSYLSLAFAISLKLYPVLALLFLLAQRRFAACCYTARLCCFSPPLPLAGRAPLACCLPTSSPLRQMQRAQHPRCSSIFPFSSAYPSSPFRSFATQSRPFARRSSASRFSPFPRSTRCMPTSF